MWISSAHIFSAHALACGPRVTVLNACPLSFEWQAYFLYRSVCVSSSFRVCQETSRSHNVAHDMQMYSPQKLRLAQSHQMDLNLACHWATFRATVWRCLRNKRTDLSCRSYLTSTVNGQFCERKAHSFVHLRVFSACPELARCCRNIAFESMRDVRVFWCESAFLNFI